MRRTAAESAGALDGLAAVGALHFATNPKVRPELEALTAGGGRKKRTTDPAPDPV